MNKHHKWKMNRAGMLNFWYYDEEIFEFSDGKLLLRGSNGSGKSVTMQSILPVLLDGKKSPDRLDPFGSKSRKMEDYLLGEKEVVDRDERTGYLFLEYKREDTQQYMTTGIGLQARRNKNMNFWGFVITDNRRIGHDFFLYEWENNGGQRQRIPLSRQQLENRIASGGQVVRAQGDYMKLVNKYIFGFDNLEAYEDLIKLLIQLRSPKLSKEFRPTAIYDILEASLPPLTDDDLRHLSDTIEHMDQTKQQIEQLKREQTALERILKRYDAYNQYKLAIKADKWLQSQQNYDHAMNTVRTKQEEFQNLAQAIDDLTEQQNELIRSQDVLEQKRTRLQNHKVWNLEAEYRQEQEAHKAIQDDYANKDKALSKKKQQEQTASDKHSELEAKLDSQKEAFADVLADLAEDADAAAFNRHSLNEADFERHQDSDHDFTVWKQEAQQHYQALDTISEEMREWELKKEKMAELDANLASARLQRDQRQQEEQDWLDIFERDKQSKLAEIHQWQATYDFLPISDTLLQQTAREIDHLYEPVSYESIRSGFVEASNNYQMQMKETIAGEKGKISQLDEALLEKQKELDTLQAKRDPEPPNRSQATNDARDVLASSGFHFLPLYEAVAFQEHVPENVRIRLEGALLDTGLLDALIADATVPFEHDRLLRPNPKLLAHTLADYLQPDEGDMPVSTQTIYDVLQSIHVESDDAADSTVINADGTYTLGLLSGHAVPVERVRFIGRNARKRYRQEQIDELKMDMDQLQSEKDTCMQTINDLKVSVQAAKDAMTTFPVDSDLSESFTQIKEKRFEISQYDKQLQELDRQLKQLHEDYRSLKSKLDAQTHELDLVFSHQAYQEAKGAMRQYEHNLHQLINNHTNYRHILEQLEQLNERLLELATEVDDLKGECNVLADRQMRKEQNIAEIEKQLESAGVEDIRQQIQTVQAEIADTRTELDQTKTALMQKQANKPVIEREVATGKQQLDFWDKMTTAWQDTFLEEVQLGLTDISNQPEMETKALASVAVEQYQPMLEKDSSNIDGQLTSVFFEENSNLMEYRMSDRVMTVDLQEWMTADWTDEQRLYIEDWKEKAGRRLIQLTFHGKQVTPYYMREKIVQDLDQQQFMLNDQDRQLYEEILFDSVGKKIRSRIARAQDWTQKMDRLMTNSDSSSGLSFSIKWKPRTAETEDEMDTKQLVDLLRRDVRLLKDDDINQVITHFRSKIDRAKELVEIHGEGDTLLQVLKDVLDYRNWFSFVLSYQRPGEPKRELTNHAFYKFSGGEKAMAMYIPLFTACYSRYLEAEDTAPYIISLDEAFAGVDENNIREMFEILEELGFDYIMNSQVLWGDYDTVSSLSICELIRPKAEDYVSVIRYQWDGHRRHLLIGDDEAAATTHS